MSENLDVANPYKVGKKFRVTPVRLFGAGPGNPSVEVLYNMGLPTVTAFNTEFFELMDEIKELTKYVYQTKNPITFVAQFSGNGGNECMATNLADPGDTIIVACSGVWGVRLANMARRYNLDVIELQIPPGEVYSFEELEREIIKHKPVTLFMTHGESSSGVLQPLDGLGDICHKHNCLLAVDAVASVGVSPLLVDRWKIDAVNGGTQKGIGAPPGMVLMSFSPRAQERMSKKKHPPPYIFDVLKHADVWKCLGNKVDYIYTFNSGMLAAIRQALVDLCEEGIENAWARHQKCSDLFVEKIKKLGMWHFVEKPENRFSGVNCVCLPKDVNWRELVEYVLTKHELEIGMGIGPTANKAIRVGFLAQNAKPELVDLVVKTLEDAISYCRSGAGTKDASAKNRYVFYV
ncbi:hypothetical protein NQ315_013081 [Exocentrus adspersus]|uniref:Alanine--glyoxylate aminotransferase n=1 Tax=Exocentrus adspersus TaxID=1586481 RepID=A0AAV8VXF1_9CUCU|nr:hypothetical protein NQ315_013081 [Exocentrus adspersus]